MRIIQKTISLEPMISRLPSVWPAYNGSNDVYYFDDESLKERQYEYPTNYGMIPLTLSFTSNTYDLGCNSSNTMSFESLDKIYTFFKNYNHLLNKAGHCGRVYTSATEYYDVEVDNKYVSELEYGTNRDVYEEMDERYSSYGGNSFYSWICNNIIPTYNISSAYTEYWKRETLFYPDVIKWIAWFKEREGYETSANYIEPTEEDVEHWNCKNSEVKDCCDCEEYFNRGGKRECDSMLEWYTELQKNINKINNEVSANTSCYTPSMYDHIELYNSLEDIGQFSSLSLDYEIGIDYRVASGYTASANTKGGTTVIDESGHTRILKDGEKGFCFSRFYMEKIFDDNDWDDYTTIYISDSANTKEFVSSAYTYYAFDDENRLYTGVTSADVINSMASGETYVITDTNSILINDTLIPIETSEFGVYDTSNKYIGGKTYFVYREKDTSTPYTLINGKKIYADSYLSSSGTTYYFSFFKNNNQSSVSGCSNEMVNSFNIDNYKPFGRYKSNKEEDYINYIVYNSETYEVAKSGVTIDDIDYYRISGYTYDKDDNIIYSYSGHLFDSEFYELPSAYTLSDDGKVVNVDVYDSGSTIIYNVKELTGHTISKLNDLASTVRLVDDVGNSIDGIYNDTCIKINNIISASSATTYAQPPLGTVLEPLYQVGNTSLINRFKLTSSATNITENYFIGNIITDMTFYYKDVNGDIVTETSASCQDKSSLSAITDAYNAYSAMVNSSIVFDKNLYCDIEYYMGATLKRESGSPFTLAYSADVTTNNYNYGVKYNETVRFVKTPVFYGLKVEPDEIDIMPTEKFQAINLPHKYTIFTYKLEQDLTPIENDIYGTIYEAPLARFTTEINTVDKDMTPNFSTYTDMDTYNGLNVSPVYKEEYKMGLSMMEKVDSDIYIDRGINAAFEKHLKLGEVTSIESMLQYGNGYFKIMDN